MIHWPIMPLSDAAWGSANSQAKCALDPFTSPRGKLLEPEGLLCGTSSIKTHIRQNCLLRPCCLTLTIADKCSRLRLSTAADGNSAGNCNSALEEFKHPF